MKKSGSGGPKQELRDALKPFCQFATCREFSSLVDNVCYEKELKVRIKELIKYRENGLMDSRYLASFERARFRREIKQRGKRKEKVGRLLPKTAAYSLASQLNPEQGSVPGRSIRGAGKKKGKAVWSRKKLKTGKRKNTIPVRWYRYLLIKKEVRKKVLFKVVLFNPYEARMFFYGIEFTH